MLLALWNAKLVKTFMFYALATNYSNGIVQFATDLFFSSYKTLAKWLLDWNSKGNIFSIYEFRSLDEMYKVSKIKCIKYSTNFKLVGADKISENQDFS